MARRSVWSRMEEIARDETKNVPGKEDNLQRLRMLFTIFFRSPRQNNGDEIEGYPDNQCLLSFLRER